MKMNLRWLAVALLLTTIAVPLTAFADGDPSGPPPKKGVVISVPSK